MKKLLLLLALLSSLYSMEWIPYEKAQKLSKESCKPMYLVVYRDGCSACDGLFRMMNQSEVISMILDDYILVKMSAMEAKSIYGAAVVSTPTIFLLDGDKHELMKP